MNEEEIVKKLEEVEVPSIEMEGHQNQLRMALLNHSSNPLKPMRRWQMLWQPVWKPIAMVGLAAIIVVSIFAVSHLVPNPVSPKGTNRLGFIGTSRNWGIAIAVIMTLCAITGPIHLLVSRKIMRSDEPKIT